MEAGERGGGTGERGSEEAGERRERKRKIKEDHSSAHPAFVILLQRILLTFNISSLLEHLEEFTGLVVLLGGPSPWNINRCPLLIAVASLETKPSQITE